MPQTLLNCLLKNCIFYFKISDKNEMNLDQCVRFMSTKCMKIEIVVSNIYYKHCIYNNNIIIWLFIYMCLDYLTKCIIAIMNNYIILRFVIYLFWLLECVTLLQKICILYKINDE